MRSGNASRAAASHISSLTLDGKPAPGNPMAGKTETGPDAADAKLFQGAVWCLAPLATAERDAIDEAVALVEMLGASPYFLDPSEHDGLVASVSAGRMSVARRILICREFYNIKYNLANRPLLRQLHPLQQ